MFIGYSAICKGFCLQQSKASYDSRLHSTRQPHSILNLKAFKTDYIQRTWCDFDKSIQAFFSKLRTDLDTIQKKMLMKRLPQQQLKTAINSNDEKLIDLSRKVFNQKYDKLTCEDIHCFVKIREGQEKRGEYLNISKREEDLAYDLMDQLKQVVYRLGKELLINRKKVKEQKGEERMGHRWEDQREERVVYKKEIVTTIQRQRRQDRGGRRQAYRDRGQEHREREENRGRKDREQRRKGPNHTQTRDNKQPEYKRERREQRPWKREGQGSDYPSRKIPKLRIVDLDKNSSQFSIELKVEGFIKSLKQDQVWRARDQTGEIKLLIPHIPKVQKGSQLSLSNCYIRQHGSELQLRVRRDGEISIQGIKEKAVIGEFYNSSNKHQKRERNFESQGYPKFTKIADLNPNLTALKMIVKVISVKRKDKLIECVLGDQTGIINAQFDVGEELLKQKNSIYFRGLQTTVQQDPRTNEGNMILIGGKRLLIELAREPVGNIKTTNNVSARVYKALEEDADE